MKEILIATSNSHKVEEFKEMLEPLGYQVRSLKDLPEKIEINETGKTFEENSMIKAMTLHQALGCAVMADDSGLMVDALDGAPGVYSARFMGEDTSYDLKNQYIIDAVKGKERGAQFVCVISYVEKDGTATSYKGVVRGEINDCILGDKGFGYDPIFYYPPYHTTLANVSEEMKNAVSHRGIALRACVEYLKGRE
ncbi:RdgB/HAM1 family non-canonical purine NTP pyrophosphatase [Traorella massiliensis]|uniref:RdgB/HAM1 family non-canonical purine NTP pyrophosphatase n=1 Tax=Traorella massiliensis TaxID=1903263 RepID=UPI0008F85C78|nr:RdgB/HAM1 family non-canonical purine NTP pyrophosphatase [Traorella massiliensis]